MSLKGDPINTLEPYNFLALFNFFLLQNHYSAAQLPIQWTPDTFFCRVKARRAWRCDSNPPYVFMADN
jgi:hypothetical protein